MRVISGKAKGRRLKVVPGIGTRPIMDRVKEALFSILGQRIPESSFLDLYAGTGSVGIEALSRGATCAVFVENARIAQRTIEENLASTGWAGGVIVKDDVRAYLRRPPPENLAGGAEIIYIAPPQYLNLWAETLAILDQNPAHIAPDGLIIVQIDPTEKGAISLTNLRETQERRYGNTLLWFFERPGE